MTQVWKKIQLRYVRIWGDGIQGLSGKQWFIHGHSFQFYLNLARPCGVLLTSPSTYLLLSLTHSIYLPCSRYLHHTHIRSISLPCSRYLHSHIGSMTQRVLTVNIVGSVNEQLIPPLRRAIFFHSLQTVVVVVVGSMTLLI